MFLSKNGGTSFSQVNPHEGGTFTTIVFSSVMVSDTGEVIVVEIPNVDNGGPNVRISTNSGSTWFTPTGPSNLRSFCMSANGYIMSACGINRNVYVHFNRGIGDSSTWGTSRCILSSTNTSVTAATPYKPCSAMSSDGTYIFWPGFRSTNGTDNNGTISTATFSAVTSVSGVTLVPASARFVICSGSGQYVLWPGNATTPNMIYSSDYGATATDISSTLPAQLITITSSMRTDFFKFGQISNSGVWYFYGGPITGPPAVAPTIYKSTDSGMTYTQYSSVNVSSSSRPPIFISDTGKYAIFIDSANRLVLITDTTL